MYDELTQVDIDKMKEELEYRITVVRPEILEDVKLARSHGDLSENAAPEAKAAAKYMTGNCDESGVAQAIEKFCF